MINRLNVFCPGTLPSSSVGGHSPLVPLENTQLPLSSPIPQLWITHSECPRCKSAGLPRLVELSSFSPLSPLPHPRGSSDSRLEDGEQKSQVQMFIVLNTPANHDCRNSKPGQMRFRLVICSSTNAMIFDIHLVEHSSNRGSN